MDKTVWLREPGVREYPREIFREAEELLGQDEKYVEAVIEAWRRRKTIEIDDLEFVPSRLGVEVYRDGEYERAWRNKAIEIAFFSLQVFLARKPKDKKVSDEDQVDVDIVVNVEKPELEGE